MCSIADPREWWGKGGTFKPVALNAKWFAGVGDCPEDMPTSWIKPHWRAYPDENGVPTIVFAKVTTTANYRGLLIQEDFPEEVTGVEIPCAWSPRTLLSNLPGEFQTAKKLLADSGTATCNRPRTGFKRWSFWWLNMYRDPKILADRPYILAKMNILWKDWLQQTCVAEPTRSAIQTELFQGWQALMAGQTLNAQANFEQIAIVMISPAVP